THATRSSTDARGCPHWCFPDWDVVRFVHLRISRLSWLPPLPTRQSSRLRMRGCLTNCENRWNSRRQHRRCCASLVHRLAQLEPVFQTMLENAARICGATFGALFLADGDGFRHVAAHNPPPELIEERRRMPVIRP